MDYSSDVDLMLIGRTQLTRLAPTISQLEKQLGRSINNVLYTREEWTEKLREGDPLILNVFVGPKIPLIGDPDA